MPDDSRAELRERLTPEQYAVTQEGATEPPFTGQYADHHDDGTYRCVVCGEPLFDSDTKFESGTGWPSFYEPAAGEAVEDRADTSHGMVRTEVVCRTAAPTWDTSSPTAPSPRGCATASTRARSTSRGARRASLLGPPGRVTGLVTALLVAVAPTTAAGLTPAQLAGQRVVYGFPGTTPPAQLEDRIRRGEAGAVLLLGGNIAGLEGARALIDRLQSIRRPAGLRAPLLVMVDQEGGLVRRLPGPPARRPVEIGAAGAASARAAGRAAGRLLRGVGANVDLAPVADVARPGSALARDGRLFGTSAPAVAGAAVAFSRGLAAAGVAATAKHFPGLGAAQETTDAAPVRIALPARELRSVNMAPFAALIRREVPLVMLGTAVYPALDPGTPAALSRAIATGELRGRLGFRGVSVTDALDTPALAPVGGPGAVAVRAAGAGSDLVMYTGLANGAAAAGALRGEIASDPAARAAAEESVARVLALRERLR